jgi:DNA-directed RNA polymerase
MSNTVLNTGLYAEELVLEREAVDLGVQRYQRLAQDAVQRGDGASLKPAERLMVHWFSALVHTIGAEKAYITRGTTYVNRGIYAPLLMQIDSSKAAVITMHSVLSHCLLQPQGESVARLISDIGRWCNAEINLTAVRSTKIKDRVQWRAEGSPPNAWDELTHTDKTALHPKHINRIANLYGLGERWPLRDRAYLGVRLLELLLRCATVNDFDKPFQPAFERYPHGHGRKMRYYIRLTWEAEKILEAGHEFRQHLRPRYQPMVVPPIEWSQKDRGGYLELAVAVVKRHHKSRPLEISDTVYEALNHISSTPWKINTRVLEVAKLAWNRGGSLAGIPSVNPFVPPPLPDNFDTDQQAKAKWKSEAVKIHRMNAQWMGDRVNWLYKLDIAERFVNRRRFYFPHQLDFTGRAYPVALHLTHQGDDLCRSLLTFADPILLGPNGLSWLKIHLANCCGIDSIPFADRIAWVDGSLEKFGAWSKEPLEYTGWAESDKPWQSLAAAIELTEVLAGREESSFPIQVDGTNNALQHYAAMLRCEPEARMVNLLPGVAPVDVYADVVEYTTTQIRQDAETDGIASQLEGWVDRKLVKTPAMTTLYGVTSVGARRQVEARLREIGFDDKGVFQASKYLSRLVIGAIRKICPAASSAMDWLADCAAVVAQGQRVDGEWAIEPQALRWTSPIGLEVWQPYQRPKTIRVCGVLLNIVSPESPLRIKKHITAFAPNFVHSVDASHMMFTALRCKDLGIHIGAVHDAYFSKPGDMDNVVKMVRDEFMRLHEEPLLHKLFAELQSRNPRAIFPNPPELGSFDISECSKSLYMFS